MGIGSQALKRLENSAFYHSFSKSVALRGELFV